jgi:hypothetical protein
VVRFFDTAIAETYPPNTMLRGPARCSGCGLCCELTVPAGAGTPPCSCGTGILFFCPWVTAGFVNPALAGPEKGG